MRPAAPATVSARLRGHVRLEAQANGEIVACFDGYSVGLGTFSAGAADRAQELRIGLPLSSFASDSRNIDKEIGLLVRRLARRGLLEYRLGRSRNGEDLVVIEPQVPDYWPRSAAARQCRRSRPVAVRVHATARRRDGPGIAARRRVVQNLRSEDCDRHRHALHPAANQTTASAGGFSRGRASRPAPRLPNPFQGRRAGESGLRLAEGDHSLVLWDFHDLLFHTRSTEGRHANPLGGVYPYVGVISPPPAVRPSWPGKKIDLRKVLGSASGGNLAGRKAPA